MKNFHAILQIPDDADIHTIQSAYRRLAKKYHPDVNKSPEAQDHFCEITEAYEFLMKYGSVESRSVTGPSARRAEPPRHNEAEYEAFRKEVRERAKKQAQMRYEKFKKQHEAFQISGINDLGLLFRVIFRVVAVAFLITLAVIPFYAAIRNGWVMLFLIFLTWPFAAIIGWYIYDNRRRYFLPGSFYYTPVRIKNLFTQVHDTEESCFYCKGKPANSWPYKLELFRLKDLRISTGGFRQHNVQYVNQPLTLSIPRSQKAFKLHTLSAFIKVSTLVGSLLFFPVTSYIWRIIAGMMTGGLISGMILFLTHTKSHTGYLYTYGMIGRTCLWLLSIILVSRFSIHPFNIRTNDDIQFVVVSIILFDCLIMQIFDSLGRQIFSKTCTKQFASIDESSKAGYHAYNDIPVISVIYPLYRWFFG